MRYGDRALNETRLQRSRRVGLSLGIAVLAMLASSPPAAAEEIVRRQAGAFPIASSVTVPAGSELVFVSGMLAEVADPAAPAGNPARLGDTETQATSVLSRLEKALQAAGLGLADVVKMNVFLVGDPAKGGRMDFDGLMRAYSKRFGGAAQPNLPARTTVQVVALPQEGALVEIEVVAARVPGAGGR